MQLPVFCLKIVSNDFLVIYLLLILTYSSPVFSLRNFEYKPKVIPDNYSENAILASKGIQTELHKIDLKYAFCGANKTNLREITIKQLQDALKQKNLTSEQLVKCYLKRIELMNPFLNAILEINSEAIQIAKKLDQDRTNGIFHGPLHGIPVLLKASMGTFDKMQTTSGTIALLGIKPKADSEVAKRLRKAGAIIIGKANLSEFSNFRGTDMSAGWSGRGGLTHNAYIRSADASGSSSGSAVAVGANMVPVALGGDTDGSITSPAREASLIGLRSGVGRVPTKGCIGISTTQDVIGPMTRTVEDAEIVFKVIANKVKVRNNVSRNNSEPYRIGVLRIPNWVQAAVNDSDEIPTLENMLTKLKNKGFIIIDPIQGDQSTLDKVTRDSETMIWLHEFKHGLNMYLKHNVIIKPHQKIKSLADVISLASC